MDAPRRDPGGGHGRGSADPTDTFDVVVFGAGIAGLTVAHELMARDYGVLVIDPAQGDFSLHAVAVGGVAKSQAAYVFREWIPDAHGPMVRATRGNAPELPRVRYEDHVVDAPSGREYDDAVDDLIGFWNHAAGLSNRKKLQFPLPPVDIVSYSDDLGVAEERAKRLRDKLLADNRVTPYAAKAQPDKLFGRPSNQTNRPGQVGNCVVFFGVFQLPGEHGFRFFPSFYRNLFDTMQRTPLLAGGQPGAKTADEPGHTVYDNLCPTEALLVSLDEDTTFAVPRRLPRSLLAVKHIIRRLYGSLGFSPQDMLRMETKLIKYATSCAKRREAEYEGMSWFEFVDGPSYSRRTQKCLESSSQALGALRAKDSDARTYGNTVIQLLGDQMTQGEHSDATLAGPTTESWFAHWELFLRTEGVHFAHGALEGFRRGPDGRLLPRYNWAPHRESEREEQVNEHLKKGEDFEKRIADSTYFVIALPVQEVAALATRYCAETGEAKLPQPFQQVLDFLGPDWGADLHSPVPRGPLKHLSGIQFFFREELHLINGHILYPDAPWGLTSISQSARWFRYRGRNEGFRSVLSVDIADWGTKDGPDGKTAWECTRQEIADRVWAQISGTLARRAGVPDGGRLPLPAYFHIDHNIEFSSEDEGGTPVRDLSPFLVNYKGDYRKRPGDLNGYSIFNKQWVLAGNYVQTHTRLTTMEAPNESARHAVNALLKDDHYRGDSVPVFKVEDSEPQDLEWFKKLDEYLFDNDARHFLDIPGGIQLLMKLLPSNKSDISEILNW